jgi:hypothetical protein
MPYSSSSEDESSHDISSSGSSSDSSLDEESSLDEPIVYYQQGPVDVLYRHTPFYQDIFKDEESASDLNDSSLYALDRNVSFFPKEPKRMTYRNIEKEHRALPVIEKHVKHICEELSTARNKTLYRECPTTLGKNVIQPTGEIRSNPSTAFMEKAFTEGYVDQFSNETIEDCMYFQENIVTSKSALEIVERQRVQDNPAYYGNCLQLFHCPCTRCNTKQETGSEDVEATKEGTNFSQYWLLHPQGQNVAVSVLGNRSSDHEPVKMISRTNNNENRVLRCDVGGTVLQLSCFQPSHDEVLSIVRTSQHASILSCRWSEISSSDLHEEAHCQMKLEEIDRFDPGKHIQGDQDGIVQLIDLAIRNDRSQLPPPFIQPNIFATLSMIGTNSPLDWNGPKDIHHVIRNHDSDEMSVEHHHILNVDSISLIEFSDMHPKVLWGAARQNSKPVTCETRGTRTRTSLGYGHSLYSIDLRSDRASFLWSPSYDEFVIDNIHSVVGIYPDHESVTPHQIYVSTSVGKGKIHLIDARVPGKTLCSWQLPSMCIDSIGRSPGGAYGCGNLFAKPLDSTEPIILGSTKEPGSLGANLYRKPKRYGNFGTRTIELVSQKGIGAIGPAALSSYFPISDDSKGLFQTGLAAFSYETQSSNKNIVEPTSSLCILSSLSSGDIVSQTLSSVENMEEYNDFVSQHISQDIHVPHEMYNLIDRSTFPEPTVASDGENPIEIEAKQPAFKFSDPSSDSFSMSNKYSVMDCIPSARLKRVKTSEKKNQLCAMPSEDIMVIADRLKASQFKKE